MIEGRLVRDVHAVNNVAIWALQGLQTIMRKGGTTYLSQKQRKHCSWHCDAHAKLENRNASEFATSNKNTTESGL
jgi:hypothetical protein